MKPFNRRKETKMVGEAVGEPRFSTVRMLHGMLLTGVNEEPGWLPQCFPLAPLYLSHSITFYRAATDDCRVVELLDAL